MEPKELVGLYEAYQQVYEPQELSEEVEIATEYFYEMGLNENGIDILIEELGEEEFVNWIYDIAEEYTLSEATQTRLQRMADAKGKIVTGPKGSRPQSTTKAAIKKMGGITKKISSSQRPGSTISGKREKAASTAVSQQAPTSSTPTQTKKGIGGFIGSIVQRAKQDTELLKKSVDTARGVAARRGAEAKAVYDAVREKGKKVEQSPQATRVRRKATVAAGRAAQSTGRTAVKAAGAAGAAAGEGVKAHRQGKTGAQIAGRAAGTFVRKMTAEEYTYILEHLLDEGYANSIETAEKIAMNMSEEWRESIVEEMLSEGLGSAVKRLFGGGKKETAEAPKSQGRTSELRQKHGVTSRTGPESPRGKILSRMQKTIDADARKHGPESSAVKASTAARNQMLRGGYSQFGMNDSRRSRGR